MNHHMRARIIAVNPENIVLTPFDEASTCRRCAEGKGCGNRPWFRGIGQNKPLILPVTGSDLHCRDTVELTLSSRGLNQMALITYALPLIAFLLGLFAASALNEGIQLLIGATAFAATVILSRPLQQCILRRCLSVQKDTAPAPCRYSP